VFRFCFILFLLIYSDLVNSKIIEDCNVIKVYDSDTITVKCSSLEDKIRVRLYCIDAPERGMLFWDVGKLDLDRIKHVTLDVKNTDMYGRKVAEVYADNGANVNKYLLSTGAAAVYPQYCKDSSYHDVEKEARDNKTGIWSQENIPSQTPWITRQQKRK